MEDAERCILAIRAKYTGEDAGVSGLVKRALRTITQHLNAHDHHFLLEVIQNAEDNSYYPGVQPRLTFNLLEEDPTRTPGSKGALVITNNEVGFASTNVEALCNVASSTKKNQKNMGYIGEKGLGFKSVFQVTDRAHIFSNGYQFSLSSQDDPDVGFAFIVPSWIEEPPIDIPENGTCMIFPMKQSKFSVVKQALSIFSAESILFLKKIQYLTVELENPKNHIHVSRDASAFPFVTLTSSSSVQYYVYKKEYQVPRDTEEPKRKGVTVRDISIAFPIGKKPLKANITGKKHRLEDNTESEYSEVGTPEKDINVFVYLPTRICSGLPFLINTDFLLNSSRENMVNPSNNRWNKWLLSLIPECFEEAFLGLLYDESASLPTRLSVYRFIPAENSTHAQQRDTYTFHNVAKVIRERLRESAVVACSKPLSEGVRFMRPTECRLGHPQLYKVLGENRLKVGLVHSLLANYHPQLRAIGVEALSPKELAESLKDPTVFQNKDAHWWLNTYEVLMDLNWSKEQLADFSIDLLLPLEHFEIDPLSKRFFPPDTIPNFKEHGGTSFVPCLRKDVHSILQQCNRRCLEWLSDVMQVRDITFSEYAWSYTKYLACRGKALTANQLIDATKYLCHHYQELDNATRRFIRNNIPIVSLQGGVVLRPEGSSELLAPSVSLTYVNRIFVSPEDRKHLVQISHQYLKIHNCDKLLHIKKFPLPRSTTYSKEGETFFGREALSWMDESYKRPLPATLEIVSWLSSVETQRIEAAKSLSEDEAWEYDLFEYNAAQTSKPAGASAFLNGLRNTPWLLALPNNVCMCPCDVFIYDEQMAKAFGHSLPYPANHIATELHRILDLRTDASSDRILDQLKRLLKQGRPPQPILERLYFALYDKVEDIERIKDHFNQHDLIWTGVKAVRSTDKSLVWSQDAYQILKKNYSFLSKQYPKSLEDFFVGTLGIKLEVPTEVILAHLESLKSKKGTTQKEVEDICFCLMYRTAVKPTQQDIRAFFQRFAYVFVNGHWIPRDLCMWEIHECLRPFSVRFLCNEYSEKLKDFFLQDVGIKRISEQYVLRLLEDLQRERDKEVNESAIHNLYLFLLECCKINSQNIRREFWDVPLTYCNGRWITLEGCIWNNLEDEFGDHFDYISSTRCFDNPQMRYFFGTCLGVPMKPPPDELVDMWLHLQTRDDLSFSERQDKLFPILKYLPNFMHNTHTWCRDLDRLKSQGRVLSTRGQFEDPKKCVWSEDEQLQTIFELGNVDIDFVWKPEEMPRSFYSSMCLAMGVPDIKANIRSHVPRNLNDRPVENIRRYKFLTFYVKEAFLLVLFNRMPKLFPLMENDGSMKQWMTSKEEYVHSLKVQMDLVLDKKVVASRPMEKSAHFDIKAGKKLLSEDEEDAREQVAEEFKHMHLFFTSIISQLDSYLHNYDWKSFFDTFSGITTTRSFIKMLNLQKIRFNDFKPDIETLTKQWHQEKNEPDEAEKEREEGEEDKETEQDDGGDKGEAQNEDSAMDYELTNEESGGSSFEKLEVQNVLDAVLKTKRNLTNDESEPIIFYKIGNPQNGYTRSLCDFTEVKPSKLQTISRGRLQFQAMPTIQINGEIILLAKEGKTEFSHRAHRQFGNRFAKVKFFVQSTPAANALVIYKYRAILKEGFRFQDRNYEFLGASDSQWRDCTCVFFATSGPDLDPMPVSAVHHWMGDFSDIRIASKCGARMGMCFTPSFPTILLQDHEWCEIEDPKFDKYIMTDGCGEIPKEVMHRIAYMAGLKYMPTAVQIRFGPYKGMLVISNCTKIIFHSSMRKFRIPQPTDTQRTLEVLNFVGTPKGACLNRQLILLLSSLNVSEGYFLNLIPHQPAVREMYMLQKSKSPRIKELIEIFQLRESESIAHRKAIKFLEHPNYNDENFQQIIRAAFKQDFLIMLHKAKLYVPNCVNLTGVLDVSKTLKPGEIFVRVTLNGQVETLTNIQVLVSRSPALHPGDIQKYRAVRVPELEELDIKDVIVFSQEPIARPDFDKHSGGDLDGDKFWTCWHEELVKQVKTEQPATYDAPPPRELRSTPVTIGDIKDSFLDYITTQSSVVGKICNAHMAYSDLLGAKHPIPLYLAGLHSEAIDCVKNGNKVLLPTDILNEHMQFPHYMAYPSKPVYHSDSACGKIYDAIREIMEQHGLAPQIRPVIEKTINVPEANPPPAVSYAPLGLFPPSQQQLLSPPRPMFPHAKDIFVNTRVYTNPMPLPQTSWLKKTFGGKFAIPPQLDFNNHRKRDPKEKKERREAERKYAIAHVLQVEINEGWNAKPIEERDVPWDVESTKGDETKYIAVRSLFRSHSHFSVRKNILEANQNKQGHVIAVVIMNEKFERLRIEKYTTLAKTVRSFLMKGEEWSPIAKCITLNDGKEKMQT